MLDGAGLDWRYWRDVHRFAVGPFDVRPKDGGGYAKRPVRQWGARAVRAWWGLTGKPETWWRRWRPGLHCGRSGVVILDVDGPDGHAGRPPLDVQRRELAAALGVYPEATAPGAWGTPSGGFACLWYLPSGVEPPPRRVVTLPGCSFTVELLSGECVAVLPHEAAAAPFWRLLRPFVARDDPAAAPIPPALWAALTAPAERRDDEDADAASADPAPSGLAAARLETVAAHVPGAVRSGAAYRAPCPRCGRRGRKDRRLGLYVRRDGRIGLQCHGSTRCPAAAILSALALPADVLALIERTPDALPPDVAAACGRLYAASDRDVLAAPPRQRETDRRVLVGLVVASGGKLDDFAASLGTLQVLSGVGRDTLRGAGGAVARVLKRYPHLVARLSIGGIGADALRSSRWRLTPPDEDADAAAAPAILPGGNAARALTATRRGRSGAWRLWNVWPDDGAAAMNVAALVALLPGAKAPTVARWIAARVAEGLAVEVPAPPGERTRGRPARWYALAGAARDAVASRSDAALTALLPAERAGRGDAVRASVTTRHDRIAAAHATNGPRGAWQLQRAERDILRHRAAVAADKRRAAAALLDASRRPDDMRPDVERLPFVLDTLDTIAADADIATNADAAPDVAATVGG